LHYSIGERVAPRELSGFDRANYALHLRAVRIRQGKCQFFFGMADAKRCKHVRKRQTIGTHQRLELLVLGIGDGLHGSKGSLGVGIVYCNKPTPDEIRKIRTCRNDEDTVCKLLEHQWQLRKLERRVLRPGRRRVAKLETDIRMLPGERQARVAIVNQCNECGKPYDDLSAGQFRHIFQQGIVSLLKVFGAGCPERTRVKLVNGIGDGRDVRSPRVVIEYAFLCMGSDYCQTKKRYDT